MLSFRSVSVVYTRIGIHTGVFELESRGNIGTGRGKTEARTGGGGGVVGLIDGYVNGRKNRGMDW